MSGNKNNLNMIQSSQKSNKKNLSSNKIIKNSKNIVKMTETDQDISSNSPQRTYNGMNLANRKNLRSPDDESSAENDSKSPNKLVHLQSLIKRNNSFQLRNQEYLDFIKEIEEVSEGEKNNDLIMHSKCSSNTSITKNRKSIDKNQKSVTQVSLQCRKTLKPIYLGTEIMISTGRQQKPLQTILQQ